MKKPDPIFGLLNIHKPIGPTSHDIVAMIRRGTGIKRVGHTGTLDPLAEGVLVLALGQATRLIEYMVNSRKHYQGQITLGIETDTYDAEGEIIERRPLPHTFSREKLETVLETFRGQIEQIPPVYSAIKVKGKSAHARARAGEELHLEARPVTIYRLDVMTFSPPQITIKVECSAGTYIRSLAHDIGQALGCGGMLSALTRTAAGRFTLDDAIQVDNLQTAFDSGDWHSHLLPADYALDDLPRVILGENDVNLIRHGRPIPATDAQNGLGRAYTTAGQFVAIVKGDATQGIWQPKKVFSHLLDEVT